MRTHSHVQRAARFAIAALALGVLTIIAGTPASAAPSQDEPAGGIGLRLLDAPVSAKDDPRARVYIVDHLAPGTAIERHVEVTNTTDSAQDVALYSAAATIDGTTFLGSEGRTVNDLASWTSVTPADASVPAGGKQTAKVTVVVPDDAAPGEQYAVVWAEARSDTADRSGVLQVSRVGIRLYVSIGPGGAPASDFEIDALVAERTSSGEPVVSATVHNTGGRALDMKGTLQLSNGPGGLAAGPFPAELGSTLAVGDTGLVRITLDERLPDGPWDATVSLESGLDERRASATITFPVSGAATPVEATTDGTRSDWMIAISIAILLGLIAAVASSIVRRRRDALSTGDPRHRGAFLPSRGEQASRT